MISPCCCGCQPRPSPILRFTNATRVTDYAGDPAGRAPYMRVNTSCVGSSCVEVVCDPGDPVCYTMGYDRTTPERPWQVPGIIGASGGDLVSAIADNYFSNSGGTMLEFPSHCTYGWKGVAASALWRGRWGFVNSKCCATDPAGNETNPSFKYGTMTYACSSSQTITNSGSYGSRVVTHNVEWNQSCSVDGNGNIQRSGSRRSHKNDTATTPTPDEWTDNCYGSTPIDNSWSENTGNSMWSPPLTCDAACGIITSSIGNGTPAEIMAAYSELDDTTQECDDGGGPVTLPSRTVVSGSIKPTITLTDNRIEITRNCTVELYQYDENCDLSGTRTHTTAFSLVITLGGEITYASVVSEAESLLGEWSLSDDTIYPWRTDTKAWLVPFVTRDASGSGPSIDWTTNPDCSFVSTDDYSGDIRGSPLPAGYGYFFNYFHRVKEACTDGLTCSACDAGLGELGAAPLPMTATQWTDKVMGADMRGHGAHLFNITGGQYGGGSAGAQEAVYAQKWAETLVKWPKYNAARPCARDRYLFDETAFVCGSLSGTTLTLDDPATLSGKVAIEDGVYQITGGSGTSYTVGARLYDTPVTCDGGVAPLRFPSARGICSEENCSAVQTSPGLVTIETTRKHWLKAGGTEQDTVTISGIGGLSSHVATVVDEYTFTISGTITGTVLSGKVSQGGSVADDTTCSANTFVARVWQSDFADPEYDGLPTETEVTLAPISRHPTVLYSSPNDTFPHGYSIEWGSISADMCYGAQWSARFEQAIADPLWQADHVPCGHSGEWSQQENPCVAADSNHYEFPPLVESTIANSTPQTIPGAVGHPNCDIEPNTQGIAMAWRENWLTCDGWKEKIAFRC